MYFQTNLGLKSKKKYTMENISFNHDLEFDAAQVKTKVLLETMFSKEIRILHSKELSMKEHKAPYPIIIHLLQGSIMLGIEGVHHQLSAGDMVSIEGGVAQLPSNYEALLDVYEYESGYQMMLLNDIDYFKTMSYKIQSGYIYTDFPA